MNDRLKKKVNNKYFIVVLVLLLITLVIGTGTYAWLTWSSPSTTKLTVKIGNIGDVIFDNGKEINTTGLAPVFNSNDGEKTKFSIVKRSAAASTDIDYTVKLNVTSIATELKSTSFKYILLQNGEQVKSGNFSTISSGSTIDLISGTLSDTRADFTFIIYIDGNAENSADMMGKAFKATISVTAEEDSSQTMSDYIINLYNDNVNGEVYNNPTGYLYKVASSVSLMNDMTNEENIRYYGSYAENYIAFNCDTYPDDNCEMWRIIGVFSSTYYKRLKIIKEDYASTVAVPMHLGSTTDMNWKQSTAGQLFNNQEAGCPGFLRRDFDSSQTCSFAASLGSYDTNFLMDVQASGIKNDETLNMLVAYPNYMYSVSGVFDNTDNGLENFYKYHTGTGDNTAGQIYAGILDAFDYAYAADFGGSCSDGITLLYDIGICGSQTWLFGQNPEAEYLINADNGNGLALNTDGLLEPGIPLTENGIYRPVVYLDTKIKYMGGSGTRDDPYLIKP